MSIDISLPPKGASIQGMQQNESVGKASSTDGTEEVSNILGKDNITVRENVDEAQDAANATPASKLPQLDEPDMKQQAVYEAIDKLLSTLQLETNEKQLETAKKSISAAATLLESERDHRAEKLVILFSLMQTIGDSFIVTNSMRKEGAAVAAFSAAIMAMSTDEQKEASFMYMLNLSSDARNTHWWFNGMSMLGSSNVLEDSLQAMDLGLSKFEMARLQDFIAEGSFDMAAKLCEGTPLADILGKAETFKEIANNLADRFSTFGGDFDSEKYLRENRQKNIAEDLTAFFNKMAAKSEESNTTLDQLIQSLSSNNSKTADILAGMKGSDTEIAGQMTQMA